MLQIINDTDVYSDGCLMSEKEQGVTRPTTLDLSSKPVRKSTQGDKKACKFNFRPLLPTRSQSAPGCILVHKRDSVVVAFSVTEASTLSTTSVKELTADEEEEELSSKEPGSMMTRGFIVGVVILVILVAASASVWSVHKLFIHAKQWKSVYETTPHQARERRKVVHPKDLTAWIDFEFSKYLNLNNPLRLNHSETNYNGSKVTN